MSDKDLSELLKLAPEVKQVQILRLEPGDIVVLSAPGMISEDSAQRIKNYWDESFNDFKCVVLGDGIEVTKVLRPKKKLETA